MPGRRPWPLIARQHLRHERRAGRGDGSRRARPRCVASEGLFPTAEVRYADSAWVAVAILSGPASVSSRTIWANLGCSKPETRNVHR